MACVGCKYKGETQFFTEEYPCSCGEIVVVSYNMCPACGSFWRGCNDTILDDVEVVNLPELRDMMLGQDKLDVDDFMDTNELKMEDCILRCVQCNSVAYAVGSNKYKCSQCTTEWEVL